MEEKKVITVTSPLLPDLDEFNELLKDIWKRKWITNNGYYHQELEKALCEYLKVPYISLFTNGTLPLIVALQALRIIGEVITTPYSFVATTHALWWNGIKPVFVDIDPETCNIDPEKIEAAITPKTTAIMPVHVYGKPCDTERIQAIADKYGLKVISYFLNSYYSAELLDYTTADQLKDIMPTFIISLTVAFTMWLISLLDWSVYLLLPIQLVSGILLAILFYEKVKLPEYLELKQLVIHMLKR